MASEAGRVHGVVVQMMAEDGEAGECGVDGGGAGGEGVAHVDRGRGVHLVLDFRLGERGVVVRCTSRPGCRPL